MLEKLELAAKYKKEYYKQNRVMRFLHKIGFERGADSLPTKYAMGRAERELNEKYKNEALSINHDAF